MRALVLGGSGFIGSHLVERLLQDGYAVSVLDVVRCPARGVDNFVGQLEDFDLVSRAIVDCDIIFHAISTTVPATSNQNIEFDISSNLISLVRLLELMRQQQIEKIVYLSSGGAVYGNPFTCPISENHPLNPISSYGVVKACAEKYLFMFQELYGLKPLVIRPSNAYGPGQNIMKPQGVIGHFLASTLKGLPLQIWGDGKVRRDYLYVRDLVDLIMLGVRQQISGIFNAGAGEDTNVLEIARIIQDILDRPLEIQFLAPRAYDVKQVRLDISKAQRTLGWQPKVNLQVGIREQLQSLVEIDNPKSGTQMTGGISFESRSE